MVELSGDGTYWNLNTAGIFKTSYGATRTVVYNRHTTANQPAETDEASLSGEQSGTTPLTRMNTPAQTADISDSKGKGNSSTSQEQTEKVAKDQTLNANSTQAALSAAEQETNTEPTEAQKKSESLAISQDSGQAGVQTPVEEKSQEGQKMVDKQRADREDTGQPKQKKSKKGNGTENAQKNENHPANQSARPTDNWRLTAYEKKKKSPFPPAVVTLKRNPKASGMARLLRKTVLFLMAKVKSILQHRKRKVIMLQKNLHQKRLQNHCSLLRRRNGTDTK